MLLKPDENINVAKYNLFVVKKHLVVLILPRKNKIKISKFLKAVDLSLLRRGAEF